MHAIFKNMKNIWATTYRADKTYFYFKFHFSNYMQKSTNVHENPKSIDYPSAYTATFQTFQNYVNIPCLHACINQFNFVEETSSDVSSWKSIVIDGLVEQIDSGASKMSGPILHRAAKDFQKRLGIAVT